MTSLGWWTWRSIFPEGGHHFPLAMPGTPLWSLDSSLEKRQFCTCYLDMGWYGFVSFFFISPTWFGWFFNMNSSSEVQPGPLNHGPIRSGSSRSHFFLRDWWVDQKRPKTSLTNVPTLFHSGVHSMYPLVNIQKTMENGHRNSEFSHETWWLSIVFCMFTRGYHIWFVDGGCSSMVIIYKLWVIML